MTLKKKNDLPPPPKLPTPAQILEDLKAAEVEDPVFFGNTTHYVASSLVFLGIK